jgi:putative copper export protein
MLWTGLLALHILAAAAWLGGVLFMSRIFAPSLSRRVLNAERSMIQQEVRSRFHRARAYAIGVILASGAGLLLLFWDARDLWGTRPGTILAVKLFFVALMLALCRIRRFLPEPGISLRGMRKRPGAWLLSQLSEPARLTLLLGVLVTVLAAGLRRL